jgi:integrase/recombinase XerD
MRDRAILETFYSTGIRRMELTNIKLFDVDSDRETLMIRQGKGKKDRVVPIGARALGRSSGSTSTHAKCVTDCWPSATT